MGWVSQAGSGLLHVAGYWKSFAALLTHHRQGHSSGMSYASCAVCTPASHASPPLSLTHVSHCIILLPCSVSPPPLQYCAASDNVRNHAGLTPLVLAAQLGKMPMLQHIYRRRRRAIYSFGRVRVLVMMALWH
jgi:hypothetical protein